MPHLRWNPLLGTYNMVAPNRQHRPHLPTQGCPFCPGSGLVPLAFDVLLYPNDFPALSPHHPQPELGPSPFYHTAKAAGHCDVVLYSPDHYKGLAQLPLTHVNKLVDLWALRFDELSADKDVKYIFPFESRGEEVGVTIHHPHGQIYAYPFIPLKIKTELENSLKHYKSTGNSLLLDMVATEMQDGRRMVTQNEHFAAFIPWFNDYPYGVYIVHLQGKSSISDMDKQERTDLADILRQVTGAMDALFNKPFPYMMCLYQRPVNNIEYADASDYYPFHIEFYTPLRAADRIKWLASSETGAWAAANTLLVEDTAPQLREALNRYQNKQG
ncbi:galactose-1-phosphate uridylyltransferase [soil metagenome]